MMPTLSSVVLLSPHVLPLASLPPIPGENIPILKREGGSSPLDVTPHYHRPPAHQVTAELGASSPSEVRQGGLSF